MTAPIPLTPTKPRTYTVRQACALLGISAPTGYALIRAGTFPVATIRLGTCIRVSKPALDRLLDGRDSRSA